LQHFCVVYYVTQCRLVSSYRRFGEEYCLIEIQAGFF